MLFPPGVRVCYKSTLEDVAELVHQALVAGHGDVVQAQDVVGAHLLGQLGHCAGGVVAVVDDVNLRVVVHQEGDKAVAEALLHHNAGGAVGHVVVGDLLIGLVTATEGQVLVAGTVGVGVGDQRPVRQLLRAA